MEKRGWRPPGSFLGLHYEVDFSPAFIFYLIPVPLLLLFHYSFYFITLFLSATRHFLIQYGLRKGIAARARETESES